MSVKCLLCNKEFDIINSTHLRFRHNVTLGDYQRMFPSAELVSDEVKQRLSKSVSASLMGHEVSEETRRKLAVAAIGNTYLRGHPRFKEICQCISETLREHWEDSEFAKRMSELHMNYVRSEETRRSISETLKEHWRDPEFAKRMSEAQHLKPNERELQLQFVLDKHFPGEWKYVGDYQFGLGGAYPDFMNVNGKKQVVEVFGYYWHSPSYFPNRMSEEELIAHYKGYGFDCLVFWEYDVYNEEEVVRRVKEMR